MFIFRILLIAAAILGIIALYRMWAPKNDPHKCKRCDGKGYWLGTRGKETCDVCKGSGRDEW